MFLALVLLTFVQYLRRLEEVKILIIIVCFNIKFSDFKSNKRWGNHKVEELSRSYNWKGSTFQRQASFLRRSTGPCFWLDGWITIPVTFYYVLLNLFDFFHAASPIPFLFPVQQQQKINLKNFKKLKNGQRNGLSFCIQDSISDNSAGRTKEMTMKHPLPENKIIIKNIKRFILLQTTL